ncbi:MAG: glycosyltransferase [Paracoccaceae bacterium]
MSASRPMRLAAVVVTFNRLDQIRATVERLLAEPVDHIVIVDNGSTDGTRAWLRSQDDTRLRTMLLDENLGGAGGFETGMRQAVAEYDPEWIVVMDDDARPQSGAIGAFRKLDTNGYDAAAAAVYYPDGKICDMNRPVLNPFWHVRAFIKTALGGGREGFHLGPSDYEARSSRTVDASSFVGFFVSRRAIDLVGYPDGKLFLYGDDGLYTLGLTRAGGRIGFFPTIRFEHDCSTFETNDGRFKPLWKVYYYHRNLLFLYRMAAGWLFWPALLIILPKWALKGRQHAGERRAFFGLLLRAVRDGLLGQEPDPRNPDQST